MTNGELWELAGRAAALRGRIQHERREQMLAGVEGDVLLYGSEIEAIMGWDGRCQKCGHPANEEDVLNALS